MKDTKTTTQNAIYLAGGCFWGLQHLMRSLPGVTHTQCGYANGTGEADANYTAVCQGNTGFRETVRVEYDPQKISLDALLLSFFYVIDPTVQNRQGYDVGTQYQTGIYYTSPEDLTTIERIAEIEKERYEKFCVEIAPLKNYFPAEEGHQDYLIHNPTGYCHIPTWKIKLFENMRIDPGSYKRPADEAIRKRLTAEQYRITRQSGTEFPFENEYWNTFDRGIYVDIVTGEPLFSSTDKFQSGCGWPAFSKPIEEPAILRLRDNSHGMQRVEVRSRAGNSHLGHVFNGDPDSPNGVRYCINSAALRFIPYENMQTEGYGYLMDTVE